MAASSGKVVDITNAMVTAPVELADWLVVTPVAIPMIFGSLLLMMRKNTQRHAVVAVFALALTFMGTVGLLLHVLENGPVVMTMGRWLPPFGITFVGDVLGITFVLTSSGVALAASLYSIRDIDTTNRRYGFYTFFLLMMAGVCGAFLTGDVFNLYVWFEVLLIASFGLLILGSEHEQLDGAVKYAFLNLVATTMFLIATGLLYGTFGTLNMADIARKTQLISDAAPLMTLGALFLFAFAMKSAAFPVNFWLPASYHTPRIVVSALFAGLLTKVGVYSLLRILGMLFPSELDVLAFTLALVATATMLLGALGALAQSDMRRLLGFIVISGIGIMLAGLALGSPLGLSGAVFYAVHSIIAMTALYLLVGLMNERAGSFSLHRTAGLYRASPFLAAIALILFLAVAGLPPFSGLWPKVFIVKAALDVGAWWLAGAILLTGFLTTIAFGRVFALAFWRNDIEQGVPVPMRELQSPVLGYGAVLALVTPLVLIGMFPEPVLRLTDLAAANILDVAGYVDNVFPPEAGQ